jgi:formylglycine-generating enzyme required for sulfatase activity
MRSWITSLCLVMGCGGYPVPQTGARGSCLDGMVHVPTGRFQMATPDGTVERAQGPTHEERLAGYCIDRTEVTVAAYARCVAAGTCTPAAEPTPTDGEHGQDRFCNGTRAGREQHPVNCVDWNQAVAYCGFLGKRLPTEAEWEYAALGADGRSYPWGNDPPTALRLNACGPECIAEQLRIEPAAPGEWISPPMYRDSDGWAATAPVGRYPKGASPFGVLDLAGNVDEWTADGLNWNGATLAEARANHSTPVIRGGHWLTVAAEELLPSDRGGKNADTQVSNLGFRCARSE